MKRSSLVIVYHRQPNEEVVENGRVVYRTHKSPNGIVPTLKSFFNRLDPDAGAWIASKVYDPEKGVDFERVIHVDDPNGGYTVSRLPLTAEQIESFYHVTSKEALWPVLHSFPRLFQYENVDWSRSPGSPSSSAITRSLALAQREAIGASSSATGSSVWPSNTEVPMSAMM